MSEATPARCPHCGSRSVNIPDEVTSLRVPAGYAINGELLLVSCGGCGRSPRLSECIHASEGTA